MAKRIQDGKLFYHITALENLKSIFENGLLSRQDAIDRKLLKIDVADSEIVEKRKELKINQYVPFHFFEKTAFTGTVYKKYPEKSFCVITILREYALKNNFKICTAHPLSLSPKAKVLDYDEGIRAIDWEKIERRDYTDEESKNACMAECLALSPVLANDFFCIFVADEVMKEEVESIATEVLGNYRFDITINPSFCQTKK